MDRMLRTELTARLGITLPIVNAPMTPQAGGLLARAVSEAGGLGMLGFDEDERADSIAEQLALVTREPRLPFGIGLVAWVLERRPELLDLALAAKPSLIAVSFGDAAPYAQRVHDSGVLLASQVQTRASAHAALAAGVDVLVAQGTEAGGHTGSSVGTLPLLQIVLELSSKPVLAAGGIASGRGVAAVLAAGAQGAWIGTPFLLASEARNTHAARDRIRRSDETQTIYTRAYDRVQGKGWPEQFGGRALRTPFLERWTGREDELMRRPDAIAQFDPREKIYAGQSVGLMHEVRGTGTIVDALATQAAQCLQRACEK